MKFTPKIKGFALILPVITITTVIALLALYFLCLPINKWPDPIAEEASEWALLSLSGLVAVSFGSASAFFMMVFRAKGNLITLLVSLICFLVYVGVLYPQPTTMRAWHALKWPFSQEILGLVLLTCFLYLEIFLVFIAFVAGLLLPKKHIVRYWVISSQK